MKKTKVIIPALGMLLLSTAASVTGTVAWFAANASVTATGMSITAKSDTTFLLIKAGHNDAESIQGSKKTSDTASTASAALYPAAHDAVANITAADTVSNWYYMYSEDPASATGKAGTKTALTAFTNYVLVNEFSITVAEGSNPVENFRVEDVTITTAGDSAVKALVASTNGVEEFAESTDPDNPRANPVTLHTAQITSAASIYVKIYIYWDGNDTDVYSNNIEELKNTSVEVSFTGDVVAA